METIGHHTCKDIGDKRDILKNGPFLAEYDEENEKLQFLGTGYYYWDNNIEMARFWGKKHYKNEYYIIQSKLNLTKPNFLDLVGNRTDILYFVKLINKFKGNGYNNNTKNWTIGHFVEFMKRKNIDIEGIFPFIAIRAIDLEPINKKRFRFSFVKNRDNFTFLDPRIIICLIDKNPVILQSKKLVE